jgi:phosphinothricin acetyltransferase
MEDSTLIRLAKFEDSDAIARIYAPYVAHSAVSFEESAPPSHEMAKRMSVAADRYPWLVCEHQDSVVGYAYASAHRAREAYRWAVDVSVYIAEAAHRQGFGRALYGALFRLLEKQGYIGAYAGITHSNASSVAMHVAFGFRLVGIYRDVGYKLGRWHDVGWYARDIQIRPRLPAEPKRLSMVLGDNQVVQ